MSHVGQHELGIDLSAGFCAERFALDLLVVASALSSRRVAARPVRFFALLFVVSSVIPVPHPPDARREAWSAFCLPGDKVERSPCCG
jgi:hypothetical protein